MPVTRRSRQGCGECRTRRRKCDEQKPACGLCLAFARPCTYTLPLVWGPIRRPASSSRQPRDGASDDVNPTHVRSPATLPADERAGPCVPRRLPNGLTIPPRYQRLFRYFADQVLASLSCHPSVHDDFRHGLVPASLGSPALLSACLALSAASFMSRGVGDLDGAPIADVLVHLQSSGLALLRSRLQAGDVDETTLATCLIWCLVDVFTCRPTSSSSWRIHLQGLRAILASGRARARLTAAQGSPSAMRHLYMLYLSLKTLPHIPDADGAVGHEGIGADGGETEQLPPPSSAAGVEIDGFLGYSGELLGLLGRINALARARDGPAEADVVLGQVNALVRRDASRPPRVGIRDVVVSTQHYRDFALCHGSFQQATLIHLYRRLYRLPSNSAAIRAAVDAVDAMVGSMTQGEPCHTWVAMAMPLFTIGCEAYTEKEQLFVLDKVRKLETCIGSHHVGIMRQALQDIWDLRRRAGDYKGDLCAEELLDQLRYNIILF